MSDNTTSRRNYYDNTGDEYEANRYADRHMGDYRDFRNDTLAEILSEHGVPENARILEVGCGTGLTLEYLSRLTPRAHLFGMDLSATMLKQVNQKSQALPNPPRLVLGDAGRLPYDSETFDVTLSTRFIHQFTHADKKRLWQEFRRVTKRNGVLVVEFYARPYHWARYYFGDGAKGRDRQMYFRHFPTRREVREIVSAPLEIFPLRMPGARLMRRMMGESALRRLTRSAGSVGGGLLTDEYFVVSRNA
jgi:ubiquinone/menaquinone biosynthesis C-methylase UbiE